MFRKLYKNFVPKVPHPDDISKKQEIEKLKHRAWLTGVAYSEAGGALRKSIESNGIFPYLHYDVFLSINYIIQAASILYILIRFLPYIRRRFEAGSILRFFVSQYSLYVSLLCVIVSLLYIRIRKMTIPGSYISNDAAQSYAWAVAMLILTVSVLSTAVIAKQDRWATWVPLRRLKEEDEPKQFEEKGFL